MFATGGYHMPCFDYANSTTLGSETCQELKKLVYETKACLDHFRSKCKEANSKGKGL